MTLTQQLQQELSNLAHFSSGEHSLSVVKGPLELSCQLVALDSLACAFMRLSLRAGRLAAMTSDELKLTAQRLSARLTYLLEPIRPIEVDAHGCVVQMRSNPPHKETDRTSYYELLASRAGELSLARYARVSGQSREIIAAHVTREVLVRLVADFCASVT